MTPPNTPRKDEVREIAEALSEAQRKALFGKCGVPRSNMENASDCICGHPAACELPQIRPLPLAYTRDRWPNGIVLTPLGIAVRKYLESSNA